MENNGPKPVLFHYTFSPYARRVVWYLKLRGIEYTECLQPYVMPRPDLAALGVQYRRIPVLAIGKDIYCDTRLIIDKLEQRFPTGALGAQSTDNDGNGKALEKLLQSWVVDGGVFMRSSQLIPPNVPLLADPKFQKDRSEFTGYAWDKESIQSRRGEGMVHVKQAFEFLESTLLADGRDWIRKTEGPSLADLEAVWPLDWLDGMEGALDRSVISAKQYPKVFAWMGRFKQAVSEAWKRAPKTQKVSGEEVLNGLGDATFVEAEGGVDENDPLKLQKGQEVVVWPTDVGTSRRDSGRLVGLNAQEVVLQRKTADGRFDVRLHFPRTNFKIVPAQGAKL